MDEIVGSFEQGEERCRELGLTPFRLPFEHEYRGLRAVGQVQSMSTGGPGTFGHPDYCATVVVTVPDPEIPADVMAAAWVEAFEDECEDPWCNVDVPHLPHSVDAWSNNPFTFKPEMGA